MDEAMLSCQWSILEHVMELIQAADAKATAALAIDSLIAGFAFSAVSDLAGNSSGDPVSSALEPFASVVLVLGAVALFASLLCMLLCLIGRTGLIGSGQIERPADTRIFFGRIVRYSREEYIALMAATTGDDLYSDISGQVHVLSQIADGKYRWLTTGYMLLLAAMALSVVLSALVFF